MNPVQVHVALFGLAQPNTPLSASEADMIKAGISDAVLRAVDSDAADRYRDFNNDSSTFISAYAGDTRRLIWEWIDDLSADPSTPFPAPVTAPTVPPVTSPGGGITVPLPTRGIGISLGGPPPAKPASGGAPPPATPPLVTPPTSPTTSASPPLAPPTGVSGTPLVGGGPPPVPPRTGGGLGISIGGIPSGTPASGSTSTTDGAGTGSSSRSTTADTGTGSGGDTRFQPWPRRRGFDRDYVEMLRRNRLLHGYRTAIIASFEKVRDTNLKKQAEGRREIEGWQRIATGFRDGTGTSADMSSNLGRYLLQLIRALETRMDENDSSEFNARFVTGQYRT
jgi:hypothetical protein